METAVMKSLLAPVKTLKHCVTGGKKESSWTKRGSKGKTCAPRINHAQDPNLLRSYQADLERERKLREAMNAQKNAERAAMRAHFRRKYQLTKNVKDTEQLRVVRGKVALPRELAQMVRPEAPAKDDSFSLLSAFQSLVFTGTKRTETPTAANTEPCKVIAAEDIETERSSMIVSRSLCVRPVGRWDAVMMQQRYSGGSGGELRRFQEIPHTGSNGWINLLRYWRDGRFKLLHKHMENTFRELGPIYREYLGSQNTVNIMLPIDIGELFRSEGLYPRRMTLQPWATHRETRRHSKGVFLKNGSEWRSDRLLLNRQVMVSSAVRRFLPLLDDVAQDFCRSLRHRVETEGVGERGRRSMTLDPSPDLFRFALEASCHVLYGERIGLFSSSPSEESERFIWAVERMLATTPPLLYLPPRLLHHLRAPLWTQHATAWDQIFSHAEARIQRGYQRLQTRAAGSGGAAGGAEGQFSGVLGELMEAGQLSLELIRANITELMAGGVDTTAVPLQFALFELARNPDVQASVRAQVLSSCEQAAGDARKALQGAPLLKGTVKETLRLYPVGITVQRYPVRDIVLQNYHVPAGTLVQVCLYPLGRSHKVFESPERFDPTRWGGPERGQHGEDVTVETGSGGAFRSLAFGFGSRQCVGRRIAENEMQLLLLHILKNFSLSVSSTEELNTKYTLILQPESPPRITFTTLSH
ncbi:cytochrome P450 11B, mitochondrial [Myxocyprinus asiaticus]|uniref:cytochrome P450 11B, mitochondrial n=1 Tax=Myxocyprinus asiaticus TaxID=70543 RepID=UPI002223EB55|nr:cytochrome P450 11B, mitochondrial [Myxocyprinus asiaticus]